MFHISNSNAHRSLHGFLYGVGALSIPFLRLSSTPFSFSLSLSLSLSHPHSYSQSSTQSSTMHFPISILKATLLLGLVVNAHPHALTRRTSGSSAPFALGCYAYGPGWPRNSPLSNLTNELCSSTCMTQFNMAVSGTRNGNECMCVASTGTLLLQGVIGGECNTPCAGGRVRDLWW